MPGFAHARVREGMAMPGLVQVDSRLEPGPVIDEILIIDACSDQSEWEGQVLYVPL
jgi:hypothetical protein